MAPPITRIAWAQCETRRLIFARWALIAAVLAQSMSSAAQVTRAGRTAPKAQAQRQSFGVRGDSPSVRWRGARIGYGPATRPDPRRKAPRWSRGPPAFLRLHVIRRIE